MRRFWGVILLAGLLCACARAVELPEVERCAVEASAICNRADGAVAAGGCVLYAVRDGRLCFRALHGEASGVLFADEKRPVTAVATDGVNLAFLYREGEASAVGRIAGGRLTLGAGQVPGDAAEIYLSVGELFCADKNGRLWYIGGNEPELLPVGSVWALTGDAVIFADGDSLRACLRADRETITALAALPGGGEIVAIAVDQATEEETRIYVLDGGGQVMSFADGSWTLHGAPRASAVSLAAAGDGCIVADADGVWCIDPRGGESRVGEGAFAIVEDAVMFAPFGW